MADPEDARTELIDFLGTIARPGQRVADCEDRANLFDAGVLDSLAVIQIILYLEQNHGVDLAAQGIDPAELGTIAGMLDVIGQAAR